MEQNEFETVDEAYNEVVRLRSAMQSIINQQPCCEGGGCFYPMHDGEGNYIGEQNVDPLGVIQGMVQTAQYALSPNIPALPEAGRNPTPHP